MDKRVVAVSLGVIFVLAVLPPRVAAQQTIEGTVTNAKLTACDPRPGGCEGSLVLQPTAPGSAPVTIKVVKGTRITEGDTHRFLPSTNRRSVAITYVEDKGEKVARSIAVKDDQK
jgi:hypothetical protein